MANPTVPARTMATRTVATPTAAARTMATHTVATPTMAARTAAARTMAARTMAGEKPARQVLYRLADEMDTRGGGLAVIMAGYEKPLHEQALSSAELRPRRYDTIRTAALTLLTGALPSRAIRTVVLTCWGPTS